MSSNPDAQLARVAARQHGRFSLGDARDCEIPPSTVYSRTERGLYVRRLPEVYAVAGTADTDRARLMEAVLYAGEAAVVSHSSAARLLGYEYVPNGGLRHVIVPGRRVNSYDDVMVHSTRSLPTRHRMTFDGIPTTRRNRTASDLAGTVTFELLRRFVHDLIRGGATPGEIRQCVVEIGRFVGKRDLLAVLDEVDPQVRFTRSELEGLFLEVTTSAGIPPTAMNYPVEDVYGRPRKIDAVYLPEGVPVELDSRQWHGLVTDHRADVQRENAIKLGGDWRDFLRFTWHDLTERPDEVVFEIREALRLARLPRSPGSVQDAYEMS